jgi:hypothetical protein
MHGTGHVNFEVVVTYIISYGFLVKIATLAAKKRGCKGPKLGFFRKKCTKIPHHVSRQKPLNLPHIDIAF